MSAFFEFPTENAREILPDNLEPVEVHHGTSIFAMTAFDFNESSVGEYGEVVMAVIIFAACEAGRASSEIGDVSLPGRDHHEGGA